MSRFIPGVPVALVLGAWSVAALAADPAPTTTPTPAEPAATTAPAAATSTSAAKPAPIHLDTASASEASVRRLVCLNMALQCFTMKPNPDDAAAKTRTSSLDLKAPDIHRVVPEVELRESLQEPEEILEEQQVQVQGTRPEIYIPGGIASLPWAVMHPTQAWRIFLPVPEGTAK